MHKRCLIVAPDFPYPPDHGGRVDIYNRLRCLNKMGCEIHLVSTYKHAPTPAQIEILGQLCERQYCLPRNLSKLKLLRTDPYQVTSRGSELLADNILSELRQTSYELMLVESHYSLAIAQYLAEQLRIDRVLLRVHNNEVTYFRHLAGSTRELAARVYYTSEAWKFSLLEQKVFAGQKFDALLHISFDEIAHYRMQYPHLRHEFLPAAIDISETKAYQRRNNSTALFVGSLFMPNNRQGLFWYLDHIHPRLRGSVPDYRLTVAGNTKGLDAEQLKVQLLERGAIEFHDSPADLSQIYARAAVFINPMLNGAGVKLKTVNAVGQGLPVVSTEIGNEGTGFRDQEHVMVGRDASEFADMLQRLLDDEAARRRIVLRAQQFLREEYDQERRLRQIISSLQPQATAV